MKTDTDYMQLALELARQGFGEVEPNPAVGCVIVKDGHILGQGRHQRFGGAHAEVNALADCREKGHDPAGATMYVTLEPCSHTGKTPPCAQAVIAAGIKKVVIASEDPAEVSGGGAKMLREAGIEVDIGLSRDEAEQMNAPFYKHSRTGLPWVIVKWAQSIDGKLAWKQPPAGENWISNDQSRADVHRLRKKVQGILTGIDTVLADNPRLTVRIPNVNIDRPPLRIVLDSSLRVPWDCHLMTTTEAPTLIVTTQQTAQAEDEKMAKLHAAGVEVMIVKQAGGHCDIRETLVKLGKRGIQQLLVETGPTLISEFLKQELADELRIYIAPMILGKDGEADIITPISLIRGYHKLKYLHTEVFNTDICIRGMLR